MFAVGAVRRAIVVVKALAYCMMHGALKSLGVHVGLINDLADGNSDVDVSGLELLHHLGARLASHHTSYSCILYA